MLKPVNLDIQCENLKFLELQKIMHISESILNTCISKNIEYLCLSGCKNITQLSVSNCRSLVLNEMRNLSAIDIPTLNHLSISWCAKILPSHIYSLLPHLQTLKIRGCPNFDFLELKSEFLEFLLLEKCINLKSLKMEGNNMYRLEIKGCNSLQFAHLSCKYIKVCDL